MLDFIWNLQVLWSLRDRLERLFFWVPRIWLVWFRFSRSYFNSDLLWFWLLLFRRVDKVERNSKSLESKEHKTGTFMLDFERLILSQLDQRTLNFSNIDKRMHCFDTIYILDGKMRNKSRKSGILKLEKVSKFIYKVNNILSILKWLFRIATEHGLNIFIY